MKKTILVTMLFALISTFAFAAKKPKYITPVPKNGQIVIKKSQLSKDASYINYSAGGVSVQLIAVIADDNTYRLSFNTCQNCNPSPNAYFAQEGKNLVCQNCGNQFSMNDVGAASYGCNPAMIPYTQTDSELIVSTEILEKVSPAFKRWQGPVE